MHDIIPTIPAWTTTLLCSGFYLLYTAQRRPCSMHVVYSAHIAAPRKWILPHRQWLLHRREGNIIWQRLRNSSCDACSRNMTAAESIYHWRICSIRAAKRITYSWVQQTQLHQQRPWSCNYMYKYMRTHSSRWENKVSDRDITLHWLTSLPFPRACCISPASHTWLSGVQLGGRERMARPGGGRASWRS